MHEIEMKTLALAARAALALWAVGAAAFAVMMLA